MDFAKKQLQKYGWKDGEGLGRNKQGIQEALKPKVKRSSTGLGLNLAEDHTNHWWQKVYNKASNNIEVKKKGDKIVMKKCGGDIELLSDKTDYNSSFVKKAVLESGGAKISTVSSGSSSDSEMETDSVLTDEHLFIACGGMTAHKGARHGLRAKGKLSRIEQQEAALLALPQYSAYSPSVKTTKSDSIEDDSDVNHTELTVKKKKKKSKNKCRSNDDIVQNEVLVTQHQDNIADNEISEKSRKRKSKNKIEALIDKRNKVEL